MIQLQQHVSTDHNTIQNIQPWILTASFNISLSHTLPDNKNKLTSVSSELTLGGLPNITGGLTFDHFSPSTVIWCIGKMCLVKAAANAKACSLTASTPKSTQTLTRIQ